MMMMMTMSKQHRAGH